MEHNYAPAEERATRGRGEMSEGHTAVGEQAVIMLSAVHSHLLTESGGEGVGAALQAGNHSASTISKEGLI